MAGKAKAVKCFNRHQWRHRQQPLGPLRSFLDFPLEKAAALRLLHDLGLARFRLGRRTRTCPVSGRCPVQVSGQVHRRRPPEDLKDVKMMVENKMQLNGLLLTKKFKVNLKNTVQDLKSSH